MSRIKNRIRTGDLLLGLNDLFTNKLDLICTLLVFQIFGAALEAKRQVLNSIYRGMSNIPLVKKLQMADDVHDSTGRVVFMLCEGFSRLVTLSDDQRGFFARVRDLFVPGLSGLQASYADEAAAATERLDSLAEMKDELEAIELPLGMTLYALIETHLKAGVEIGELLSTRAKEEADEETKRTKQLHVVRVETLKLLRRFRDALAQEIEANPELPRDLDAQVFSYLDTLSERREESARSDDAAGETEAEPVAAAEG